MIDGWKLRVKPDGDRHMTVSLVRESDALTFLGRVQWRYAEWNDDKGYCDYTTVDPDEFREKIRTIIRDILKECRSWERIEDIIDGVYVDLSTPDLYFHGYH